MGKVGRARPRKTLAVEGGLSLPMKKLILKLCVLAGLLSGVAVDAADKAKVVFISGKPSHGRLSHEHRAGNMLLAKALNESGLPVEAVVLKDVGYPKDESVLDDAATIVIFCTGHGGHVLNRKLKEFDALMKRGKGVVMIHWATEAVKGDPADKFLEWMGGFCDLHWSVNPHWIPKFKPRKHEIWNGLKPFSVNDAWYYHMRFVNDLKGGGQWRDPARGVGLRARRWRARLWLHRRARAHELAIRL